ncbi:MAG: bifunctional pyr operon transcriptional regulator/uracil phosphoribosyltransferase PyrR [Deltaproteobacteria bacterium]|jgi:pyrimidine operon attenuation protein/uracil phosphoribosyltransferase|nr:bifunctional pyr operon transcriptional regulator/uracil phosphoribosyltransferase PyrR [Deltaproteobacteria bacterium]
MAERVTIHGPAAVKEALARMGSSILERREDAPVFVGIRRGGLTVSELLQDIVASQTGERPMAGIIDINLYRDDWTLARAFPKVGKTEIPFSVEGKRVLLVDDVLFTGRTVRAALEALTEFGRSKSVELAVLVDRGRREMPIQPDYASFVLETTSQETVEVSFTENGEGEVVLFRP